MKISRVWKAIAAAIGLTAEAIVVAGADEVVDLSETQHIVISIVTGAIGVYAVYKATNSPAETDNVSD